MKPLSCCTVGFTREYIFPMKILLLGVFKCENATLQNIPRGVLIYCYPGGSTYLLVNMYWGSSYFLVNSYWGVLFFGEYLLTVTPDIVKFQRFVFV